MESGDQTTERKLLRAFMQFKKADWHERSISGYKPSEVKLLFCLRHGRNEGMEEMKVSEISRRLHVTSPTVTQLINALEAEGLVERNIDSVDRRVVQVRLTEKGDKVTRKAKEVFAASFRGLVDYLGEEDSEKLAELLSKVFVYYNEKQSLINLSPKMGSDER
ncbi:MarR family winged helix-turn-helix transcriptional regulator [Paenibacillus sp. J2TS4]|uniref:MarR family winged helix-turn-helix transcriptional regulator n=1 Tax=Paenibacillus sp. J2TS4 TaxID=2807194 RepID=UPI001B0AF689|nr:MarR family transcriptional regulator [Paenibacillus sp. J2TS4]GIP36430.1 hypothetical protein J2TS4_56400 [Paenibacillus sp. J2TS4]